MNPQQFCQNMHCYSYYKNGNIHIVNKKTAYNPTQDICYAFNNTFKYQLSWVIFAASRRPSRRSSCASISMIAVICMNIQVIPTHMFYEPSQKKEVIIVMYSKRQYNSYYTTIYTHKYGFKYIIHFTIYLNIDNKHYILLKCLN